MFEARKRYDTKLLDYIVTSNHIHLLVYDTGNRESIPKMMQLIAGRTAQEYNCRITRKGAFWEDRYHATAVETDEHLIRCIVYIDLNMVRAGVVKHPSDWKESGYNEIQNPRKRYSIIDHGMLLHLLKKESMEDLKASHHNWVEQELAENRKNRQAKWSESMAVGSNEFVVEVKKQLCAGRIESDDEMFCLRETQKPFGASLASFTPNETLNSYEWDVFS